MRWPRLAGAGLAVALLASVASSAHAARSVTLPAGQGVGLVLDAAGTAHVAWKNEGSGNQVFACTLARTARTCTPPVTLTFPGDGFNLGDVTVLNPAANVIDVIVGRNELNRYGAYLARSVDNGATFAPGYEIANGSFAERAAQAADGRIGLVGGPVTLHADAVAPDGSSLGLDGPVLAPDGFFTEVAAQGSDLIALGGGVHTTTGFRLPAGASAVDPNAWVPLPIQQGGRGVVAGGPVGVVSMLDSNVGGQGRLYAQRLESDVWSPPVTVLGKTGLTYATQLDEDAAGRVHALWTNEPGRPGSAGVYYAVSGDGAARWSRGALLAPLSDRLSDLSADFLADGSGAVAANEITVDKPITVIWVDPRKVPATTLVLGGVALQVRSTCSGRRFVTVEVRASRAGRPLAIGAVLRGASFTSQTAPRIRRGPYSATFRLPRGLTSTGVRARLRPRSGPAQTVRVRALSCFGRL